MSQQSNNTEAPVVTGPLAKFKIGVYGSPRAGYGDIAWGRVSLEVDLPDITLLHKGREKALRAWTRRTLDSLLDDVKHSYDWYCSSCKFNHAGDFVTMIRTPYPDIFATVHLLCNARSGPCHDKFLRETLFNGDDVQFSRPLRPNEYVFALAASCAGCKKLWTTLIGPLRRCGDCRFTRYCSATCWLQDRPRHERMCQVLTHNAWSSTIKELDPSTIAGPYFPTISTEPDSPTITELDSPSLAELD